MENMRLPKLKFGVDGWDNSNFDKGLNLTVRRGIYWSTKVKAGDAVELTSFSGQSFGEATIDYVVTIRFCDIPDYMLKFEHEPQFRTYAGLLYGMRQAYTPVFLEEEICTLIFFRPNEK